MRVEQVELALCRKFIDEGARLVFWHDESGEFADFVAGGLPEELVAAPVQVQVLKVGKGGVGGLSAKLRLEREDVEGKYLIYSRGERPPPGEDWLLDIRLYSVEFHADMASIWLQELGLGASGLHLHDHLKARAAFLGHQDRRQKLKRFISGSGGEDEAGLDLKMMAVLVGSDVASAFSVLRALCHGHLVNGGFELSEEPQAIATFEKMGLFDGFWELMRQEFGYDGSGGASVAGLLRRLFVSELFSQLGAGASAIAALAHFELPAAGGRNAVVCLTQWRDSSARAESYDAAAVALAAELKIGEHLEGLEPSALGEVFTFWEAERRVVAGLRDRVLGEAQSVDVEAVAGLASERRAGHWLAGPGRNAPERRAVADAYDAIVAAAELFALHARYRPGFTFEDARALLAAYQEELCGFDRLYRRFWTRARPAQGLGWDLLKGLAGEVERVYDQGFLQPLGLEWSRLLDAGFLGEWSPAASGLPAQQDFFAKTIAPHLGVSERKRAFVIISDALRYEAAQELTEALNGQYRMDAALAAMLGVLPSNTALGMASLLPHRTLSYGVGDKAGVLVDGKAVAGTAARGKRMASVEGMEGMACQAKDLRVMTAEEARDLTRGKRVVYIYHNVIDARGDDATTEGETFEAVAQCIDELVELVGFCVNKLNAAKVWVTADHGFLFQQEAPDLTDKSQLAHKPESAVKMKKRYVIGRALGATPEAHHGTTKVTAGAEGAMEFWVPRGANRFHFSGGARFCHGGAMPQEVLLPLVTVTQLRGMKTAGSGAQKVAVQVLGGSHKITTPKYRFELIQTEAVSERRLPITLRAAVYDGARAVTSVETVTFDSASESIEARRKSIRLALRSGTYDKTKAYRLVLRDVESDAEVQSLPVVIDRSFDDDF